MHSVLRVMSWSNTSKLFSVQFVLSCHVCTGTYVLKLFCYNVSVFSFQKNKQYPNRLYIGSVRIQLILLKTKYTVVKSFLNVWIVLWDPFLIKFLVKKDVCGSCEQCTGPTISAISDQCADIQSASGSCALCTGPTSRSVSHEKPTFGKKKKNKKKEETWKLKT